MKNNSHKHSLTHHGGERRRGVRISSFLRGKHNVQRKGITIFLPSHPVTRISTALPSREPREALMDCTSARRTSDADVFAGRFCTDGQRRCPGRRGRAGRCPVSGTLQRGSKQGGCARAHPTPLPAYKCGFLRNRFVPEVLSIFHAAKRPGELLAGGAGEITGLSGGQRRAAALSFRQDNVGVKDGSGRGSTHSRCTGTVLPRHQIKRLHYK